jgi:hypothetical protein
MAASDEAIYVQPERSSTYVQIPLNKLIIHPEYVNHVLQREFARPDLWAAFAVRINKYIERENK